MKNESWGKKKFSSCKNDVKNKSWRKITSENACHNKIKSHARINKSCKNKELGVKEKKSHKCKSKYIKINNLFKKSLLKKIMCNKTFK